MIFRSWTASGHKVIAVLLGVAVSGCVSGPAMPKGTLPWEYGGDLGKAATGDYLTVSGPVAQFGEVPKAAKPVTPESLNPDVSEPSRPASSPVALFKGAEAPAAKQSPPEQVPDRAKKEYDFVVADVKVEPPLYRPAGSAQGGHDVTAFNRGAAPVSVVVDVDEALSENTVTDKEMPVHAVVPPNSEAVLFHYVPKRKMESTRLSFRYSWSIGDYQATHSCPERYRFPFPDNIRAYASVPNAGRAKPAQRYDLFFTMPAGTPIRAIRKGKVIRLAGTKIDILHEDATVATYWHVGKIAEGIDATRTVSAGETLGTVGALGNEGEAYVQLSVWRPQLVQDAGTPAKGGTFEGFSFPLEFCRSDGTHCTVLTKDQPISAYKAGNAQKPNKRKKVPETAGSS